MGDIYQTRLELALDLKLESIGFPLGKRRYFNDIAIGEFLERREMASFINSCKGEVGIPDSVEKDVEDILNTPTFPENPKEVSITLIKRTSFPNKNRFFIIYGVTGNDEDYKMLTNLGYNEYIRKINELIKEKRFCCELVSVGEMPIPFRFDSEEESDVREPSGGLVDLCVFPDHIELIPYDPDFQYKRYFGGLDGKPPNVGEIVERVSAFMLEDHVISDLREVL